MSAFAKTVWTKIKDGFESPTKSNATAVAPPYASRTYAFDGDVIMDLNDPATSASPTTLVLSSEPHRPIFTVAVSVFDILLLIIMYIVQRGTALSSNTWIKMGGKYVPCMRPLSSKAQQIAYNSGLKSQCHAFLFPYQIYRFFTPMFLHGGIRHLLNNLVYQALAGSLLERKYGTKKFGICYLLFGFSGNVMSALSSPRSGT